MDTTWERFHAATLCLARAGTIKERLQSAFRQQLADLDPISLPGDVRDEFCAFLMAMNREQPMRGEDAITATIRKLSNQEAEQLAAALVDMFGRLSRCGEAAQPTVTRSMPSATVVPLFAAEAS